MEKYVWRLMELLIILMVLTIAVVAIDGKYKQEIIDKDAIIKDKNHMITSYVAKLKKKCPEYKDCSIHEYKQGYIIDGYYYEFKGSEDIKMEGEE